MNARTYILKQEHAALFKPPENVLRSRTEALAREEKDAVNTSGDSSQVASGRTSSEMVSRPNGARRLVSPSGSSDPTQVASILQQQQQSHLNSRSAAAAAAATAQTLIPRDAFAGPFQKGTLLADQAMRSAPLLPAGSNGIRPANSNNSNDFSVHPRTRDRLAEEQRRAELRERSQRARTEGTPLAELAGRRF